MADFHQGHKFEAGVLQVTVAAPSGATFLGGRAFDSGGLLHVANAAPAAGDPRVGGIAHKATGELYVSTTTDSSDVFIGGFRVSTGGRLLVEEDGTPTVYVNGFGLNASGQVCVNGTA